MDNVKDDNYYLKKVIADLQFLTEYTKGCSQDDIEENPLLLDSIMFRMIQIAENTDKLSAEFKSAHDIPWRAIKGMRNKIVHDYGMVDLKIIYDTVKTDIPSMYELLSSLI